MGERIWLGRAELSCKREQLSLLKLPSAADMIQNAPTRETY